MTDNNITTIIKPLPVVGKEVALNDLLSTLLINEGLHDLTLKGTDGVEVGCHRAILAARSSVFQGMLFGKYSEASQKIVEVGFTGDVLKAVVEYIYTDEPQILNTKKRKSSETYGSKTEGFDMKQLKILLSLADASNFFHLPGLVEKASSFLSQNLKGYPTYMSIAVLEVLMQEGPAAPGPLVDAAMDRVRKDQSFVCSGDNNFSDLSNSVMEMILQDKQMRQTEQELFLILLEWMEADPEERRLVATDLTKHIRLENIDPVTLENKVIGSGLVPADRLLEAYRNHSLWPWKESRDNTNRVDNTFWCNGNSSISAAKTEKYSESFELDLLEIPPMKSGVYQWKIGILSDSDGDEDLCSTIWLGIAAVGIQIDSSVPLGEAKGGWSISNHGSASGEGRIVNEFVEDGGFSSGMEVTFILDLSHYGFLAMSTAEDSETFLFDNLCDYLKKNPRGFVPAVSTRTPGRIRILKVQKLSN